MCDDIYLIPGYSHTFYTIPQEGHTYYWTVPGAIPYSGIGKTMVCQFLVSGSYTICLIDSTSSLGIHSQKTFYIVSCDSLDEQAIQTLPLLSDTMAIQNPGTCLSNGTINITVVPSASCSSTPDFHFTSSYNSIYPGLNLNFTSGSVILIDPNITLTITGFTGANSPLSFNNCTFILQKNAKIEIADADVHFTACTFIGCTGGWDYIKLLSNNEMKFENCIIEDAKFGIISVASKPILHFVNNYFNQNNIGIQIINHIGEDGILAYPYSNTYMLARENTFTFNPTTNSPSPLMLQPFQLTDKIGIKVINCSNIILGDPSDPAYLNTFENLNSAVKFQDVFDHPAYLVNATFNNINNANFSSKAIEVYDCKSVILGGFNTDENLKFELCENPIDISMSSEVKVLQNSFLDCSKQAFKTCINIYNNGIPGAGGPDGNGIGYNFEIVACENDISSPYMDFTSDFLKFHDNAGNNYYGNDLFVKGNTIKYCERAIFTYNNSTNIVIVYNVINTEPYLAPGNSEVGSTAMLLLNNNNPNHETALVSGNSILNFETGVDLRYFTQNPYGNTFFEYNAFNVDLNSFNYPGAIAYKFKYCAGAYVMNNTAGISGGAGAGNGYIVENSDGIYFTGNYVNNFDKGIFFSATGPSPTQDVFFRCNKMENCNTGLHISSSSNICNQGVFMSESHGNEWRNILTSEIVNNSTNYPTWYCIDPNITSAPSFWYDNPVNQGNITFNIDPNNLEGFCGARVKPKPIPSRQSQSFDFVKVFPNPVNELLTIQVSGKWKNAKFTLFDANGNLLLHESLQNEFNNYSSKSINLAEGLYLVKLQDTKGEEILTKKIIISH